MVEYKEAPPQQAAQQQFPVEYPPRTSLEFASKTLQSSYSKRGGDNQTSPFKLLDIDLVLSNLTPAERDAAAAYIDAMLALQQLELAVQADQDNPDIHFSITEAYDLKYCFQVESSRGLEAKTLDAVTKQRIEQTSSHKESVSTGEQKKAWYRSVV
jgi:hypothetical protein